MIRGFATPEQTAIYGETHTPIPCQEIDGTGLVASAAGFGCYRVSNGIAIHEASLSKALESGVNLVDTSSNYADGGSEKLIGEVLERLIASDRLMREAIIVVSKVGYIQGRNHALSQERKRNGVPFKELVPYAHGLEHCIHPGFLEDQLTRSLERLKLETLDFYLLHNPEYYLGWAHQNGIDVEKAQTEYYRRIHDAFRHLEKEATRGRIRFYGMSSNTLPAASDNPEFTCLERLISIASSIASAHHFRLIQFPMNLMETGAVLEANQPSGRCVLHSARANNIGVLVNRPLNAITADRIIRLADPAATDTVGPEEIDERIDRLIESENYFSEDVLPKLPLAPSIKTQVLKQLAAGWPLKEHWRRYNSLAHWQQVAASYFRPRIQGVMNFLEETALAETLPRWKISHLEVLHSAIEGVSAHYTADERVQAERIKQLVSHADPDWQTDGTLSQLAVRAVRSTRGVTCVLVGMRKESYVQDILHELKRPVCQKDRFNSWNRLREDTDVLIASL